MIDTGPPWPPRSVAEDLGTMEIRVELSAIITDQSYTICKDGMALTPDQRSGWGIQSLLVQLASGVDPFFGLERLTVV